MTKYLLMKLQKKYGTNLKSPIKKQARSKRLVKEYKLFKIIDDEDVKTMFSRFRKIVSELKFLGIVYANSLQVRKLIQSLLKA